MFIPKGVKVGDMDLSGGVINPIFMQEDKFNKNMMVATFYKTYLQDNAVTVNVLKDGKYEKIKVDVDVIDDKSIPTGQTPAVVEVYSYNFDQELQGQTNVNISLIKS